jgi:hypothetical protein
MTEITGVEYWQEIQGLANDLREEARVGEFGVGEEARENFQERTWETIDSHEWVIYTAYNYPVLSHSNNDAYAVENFGVESIVLDGALHTAGLAFGAMYGDLWDTLFRLDGFDPNDPNPEKETAIAKAEGGTS